MKITIELSNYLLIKTNNILDYLFTLPIYKIDPVLVNDSKANGSTITLIEGDLTIKGVHLISLIKETLKHILYDRFNR